MTSFSTCSKSTLPPPFAATFGDRRPDLLSWRDLYTDAILFQSGREAGNLAPGGLEAVFESRCQACSSSSNAFASFRSSVSKPSVNQP